MNFGPFGNEKLLSRRLSGKIRLVFSWLNVSAILKID